MNNAEKFKQIFGLYATELWSMPESDFLEWLNRDVETTQIDHNADIGKKADGDCISRQAAIDALHMHLMYRMGTDSNKKRLDEWINNLPPAQPDIIRCKDCKHWKFDHTCREHSLVSPMMANEFCSRAERREG